MKTDEHCVWPGCKAPARSCHPICGHLYCRQHYDSALREHFLAEYARWDGESEPAREFLYLFVRYTCQGRELPDGLLRTTPDDRTCLLRKTQEGLEFRVLRHPGHWTMPGALAEVEERWAFNAKTSELRLLEGRPGR